MPLSSKGFEASFENGFQTSILASPHFLNTVSNSIPSPLLWSEGALNLTLEVAPFEYE